MPRARRKERTGGRTSSRKTRLCTRRCRRQSFSCEHCGTSNCSRFVAAAVESNVFHSNDGFSVHKYSYLKVFIHYSYYAFVFNSPSHRRPATPVTSHQSLQCPYRTAVSLTITMGAHTRVPAGKRSASQAPAAAQLAAGRTTRRARTAPPLGSRKVDSACACPSATARYPVFQKRPDPPFECSSPERV